MKRDSHDESSLAETIEESNSFEKVNVLDGTLEVNEPKCETRQSVLEIEETLSDMPAVDSEPDWRESLDLDEDLIE